MNNHPNKLAGAFCIVIMIAGFLAGTSFAQAPVAPTETQKARQLSEGLRRELLKKLPPVAVRDSRGGDISFINKGSFSTGSWFAFAISDFSRGGQMEKADFANAAIADLVFLIDSLENQPEAASLQKTLRSFVRRTSTIEQILREIQNSSISYSERLSGEQKWYFNSGMVVTNLVLDSIFQNSEAVIAGVSKTQGLVKTAPKGTSPDILEILGKIVKFSGRSSLAQADYQAIGHEAYEIFDLIAA